jgi:carbonic anhydrase
MSSPLNIDGSHLKFSQYQVDTELLSVFNVSIQKNKSGFFEAR